MVEAYTQLKGMAIGICEDPMALAT